jgi:hypothetical protein
MTEQYRTIGPKIKGLISDRRSFYRTCPSVRWYFVFTAFWLMCLSSMITKIIFKRFITIRPGLQKGLIRTLYPIHKVFWLDDTEVLSHHFFLNVFPSKLWFYFVICLFAGHQESKSKTECLSKPKNSCKAL